MGDPVLEAMDRFSGPISDLTRTAQRQLLSAYRAGWTSISTELEALQARIASAPRIPIVGGDGVVTQGIPPSWTFQEQRYISLQNEVRGLVAQTEDALGTATSRARPAAWEVGGDEALQAGTRVGDVPISSWARPPTAAFQAFVGSSRSGPLAQLLQGFAVVNGPKAASYARDVLGAGLLRGRSAFAIADDLRSGLQTLTYSRALRIARTETIRAYREGARQSYLANPNIVQSWQWRAAVENTERPPCAACFAKHGSIHPISEPMSSHPNCRCRMVPRRSPVLGISPRNPQLPDGTAAFNALPPATQRRILGPTRLEMYRGGRVKLEDFATSSARGPWGVNNATVRPLRDLRTLSSQNRALPQASDRLFRQASQAEPGVSATLQRIGQQQGAELEGFGFRLKSTDRIAAKIQEDVLLGKGGIVRAGEHINDALRYTYRLKPGTYSAQVQTITRSLLDQGYTFVKPPKNFWQAPSGYRGYHTLWRTPEGARFELQFHTAQSLAVKAQSHVLYEIQRLATTTPARRAQLQAQIDELWASLRAPSGVKRIPDTIEAFTTAPARTFRSFQNADDANAYFGRNYGDVVWSGEGSGTVRGMEAAENYTGAGYYHLNRSLRATADPYRTAADEAHATFLRGELDRLMRKQPIVEDVQVYRGLEELEDLGQAIFGTRDYGSLVGKTFTETAYMSTTVDASHLRVLNADLQVVFNVPQGTGGLWLRPVSQIKDEAEFLLDRGLRYTITKVERVRRTEQSMDLLRRAGLDPDPYAWRIEATILP